LEEVHSAVKLQTASLILTLAVSLKKDIYLENAVSISDGKLIPGVLKLKKCTGWL
jgi:hypothetical protein